MSFANTSTNKPMMWSRIIMNESGIYDDYQQILNNLLDPKLIYFSEDIHLPQIEECKYYFTKSRKNCCQGRWIEWESDQLTLFWRCVRKWKNILHLCVFTLPHTIQPQKYQAFSQ